MTRVKIELQLCYVLHARPYRETSLLLEVMSQEYGRVSLVAQGAKRGKAKASSVLQPFVPLHLSWTGSGELATLVHVELAGNYASLHGKRAICGLYMNELLVKLLHKFDPCANLFVDYQNALQDLACMETNEQIILRKFEKQLLKSLGYALQLTCEVESGVPLAADSYYSFDPILGPKLVSSAQALAIKGSSLLALAAEDFTDAQILADVRRLMRSVFAYHLGNKQLVSRQLI